MTSMTCANCKHIIRCLQSKTKRVFQHRLQVTGYKLQRQYSQQTPRKKSTIDLSDFPTHRIRNFSIIAHVDHGKSTLADRLLELTGVINAENKNEQVLDKLQVERERGITVKAQTASLLYDYNGESYLLNLIDTPGHVDFNYEVSRSLAACQGVILLVDANQGVQAQTVANFFLAFESNLSIVTVMNKIDLKVAKPEEVAQQIETVFDIKPEEIIKISAKLGTGVEDVLNAVVEQIPPNCIPHVRPTGDREGALKALLFDSSYDKYRGVVTNIAVKDGFIKKGDRVMACHLGKSYEVQEVGVLHPGETSTDVLYAGQVGYMYANMKNPKEALLGDTICHVTHPVEPLPGFKAARPMVFAGVFPMDQSEFSMLRTAIDKLVLNDPSVQVNTDSSAALGQGWRLGFLGLLHLDVFQQRLEQEYDANVIVTSPNVPYKVHIKGARNIKFYGKEELTILNPCHLPSRDIVSQYEEPMVLGTIISPDDYIGDIYSLVLERRGQYQEQHYIDEKRVMFKVLLPLNEIVVDFFDKLKSTTSGYASFDYEDNGYVVSDLVKLDVYLNGVNVEELTQICHITKARTIGKFTVAKLKETLPQQLFEIVIQAKLGVKVLARENIKALRKDVLAKCYGGDITRKMKLLRRQAEGKKRMKMFGNIEVPKETFIEILKK